MLFLDILLQERLLLKPKDIEGRKQILIKQFEAIHKDILRLMKRSPLSTSELEAFLRNIEGLLKIMHEVTMLNIQAKGYRL